MLVTLLSSSYKAVAAFAVLVQPALLRPLPAAMQLTILWFIRIYDLMIWAWVILSWFVGYKDGFARRAYLLLDPLVAPFVSLFRFVPIVGGLDFSPYVAGLALHVLAMFL